MDKLAFQDRETMVAQLANALGDARAALQPLCAACLKFAGKTDVPAGALGIQLGLALDELPPAVADVAIGCYLGDIIDAAVKAGNTKELKQKLGIPAPKA